MCVEMAAEIVVSMLVVCERLGNRLNQGLSNILDFTFSKLAETEERKRKLIAEFWREVGERLEDDMGLDVLVQLGVHIGLKSKNAMPQMAKITSEIDLQSEE